ncbi:hypothetical protein FRC07_002956 [Ceratobasidium sp. 392]|nr:hypothetical protein FRC07_002956 [Ceratobasidium sp. 392]
MFKETWILDRVRRYKGLLADVGSLCTTTIPLREPFLSRNPRIHSFIKLFTMQYLLNIAIIATLFFGLVGSAFGAPIDTVDAGEAVARGNNDVHHGWATHYDAGAGRGACGWDSTSNGDSSSNACGKTATVTWRGKSVKARVVDMCPICGHDNIDLSPSTFEQLADKSVGKLYGISWEFD